MFDSYVIRILALGGQVKTDHVGFEGLERSRVNHLILDRSGPRAPVDKHQFVNIPGRNIRGLELKVEDGIGGHILGEVLTEGLPVLGSITLLDEDDLPGLDWIKDGVPSPAYHRGRRERICRRSSS